ncbi:MAG: ATP phosphoribosyltransferase regulatory subunit [Clostridia bacterium]|nr:ATP phosphoribosyltransferase regulatory subunit [Clostridia bacterium]
MSKSVIKKDEQAIFSLRELYRRYGYAQYKMSRFEEYDLYVRNKDFLVSDEVITFTDHTGRLLALKPDVTLSIIKNTEDRPGAVQKVYYNENVFRVAKGTHSFKEIMQAGLECIGDISGYEIAEVVLLAVRSLSLLNERYMLDLSHMGLVSAMLAESGLSEGGKSAALSFIHQKSGHELAALCEKEGVSGTKLQALIDQCGTPKEVLAAMEPLMATEAEKAAFADFSALCEILTRSGHGKSVRVDFSVGNDMKYYSGVVFKGYLEGVPTGVLSGGQYDKLLQKLGRKSGAIGFAVYLDLLERLEKSNEEFDVDTLLLRTPDADPAALVKKAEELSAEGSVLVVSALPEDVKYRRLIQFEGGNSRG